jgi:hypothetical protein
MGCSTNTWTSLFKYSLNDILIYSWMMKEHGEHLRLVLQCLRENKLYGNCRNALFINRGFIIWGMLSPMKESLWIHEGRGYYGMAYVDERTRST